MDTATKGTVKRTVPTEVREEVFQLTLSRVEARALYALTAMVWTGSGSDTYERDIRAIREALLATRKLGMVARTDFFYVDDDDDIVGKRRLPVDSSSPNL